jgi:hypothetical protein
MANRSVFYGVLYNESMAKFDWNSIQTSTDYAESMRIKIKSDRLLVHTMDIKFN